MDDDLVKRLRDFEQWLREPAGKNLTLSSDLFDEAADRIEAQDKRNKALEAALRDIEDAPMGWPSTALSKMASAALAGKKKDD